MWKTITCVNLHTQDIIIYYLKSCSCKMTTCGSMLARFYLTFCLNKIIMRCSQDIRYVIISCTCLHWLLHFVTQIDGYHHFRLQGKASISKLLLKSAEHPRLVISDSVRDEGGFLWGASIILETCHTGYQKLADPRGKRGVHTQLSCLQLTVQVLLLPPWKPATH